MIEAPRAAVGRHLASMPLPSRKNTSSQRALRLVALMEAVKGLIVFGAGFGLLALLHRDVRHIAESLVTRLHIDPENHFAGIFLHAAARLTDARLWGFAALALAYSALRWTEAWGLWFHRRWAEWLGAVGGAIYLPVELYELWHQPSPIKLATLTLNLAVVAYLGWTLRQSRAAVR
ncbi:DUF2127 domain-containing protein [Rhizobacter fulvus]